MRNVKSDIHQFSPVTLNGIASTNHNNNFCYNWCCAASNNNKINKWNSILLLLIFSLSNIYHFWISYFFFSCLLTAMRIVNLTLAAVTYVDVLAQHCTSSIVFSLVLVPNHKFQAIFVVVAANHLWLACCKCGLNYISVPILSKSIHFDFVSLEQKWSLTRNRTRWTF